MVNLEFCREPAQATDALAGLMRHGRGRRGALADLRTAPREDPRGDQARRCVGRMDGSETGVLGTDVGAPLRIYERPGLEPVERLRRLELEESGWAERAGAAVDWRDPAQAPLAVGQD